MSDDAPKSNLKCSFCGQGQPDRRLIAGPGVFICHECIDLCWEIVNEQTERAAAVTEGTSGE